MLIEPLHRLLCSALIGSLAACASAPVARQDPVPDVPLERPTAAPGSPVPASAYVWSDPLAAASRKLRSDLPSAVSVAQSTDGRLWVSVPAQAAFDPARSALRPAATPWLDRIAAVLRELPRSEVQIFGEPDPQSRDDRASHGLALDRAASARDWMVGRGLPARRIAVAGRHLVAATSRDARRLDIVIGERAATAR